MVCVHPCIPTCGQACIHHIWITLGSALTGRFFQVFVLQGVFTRVSTTEQLCKSCLLINMCSFYSLTAGETTQTTQDMSDHRKWCTIVTKKEPVDWKPCPIGGINHTWTWLPSTFLLCRRIDAVTDCARWILLQILSGCLFFIWLMCYHSFDVWLCNKISFQCICTIKCHGAWDLHQVCTFNQIKKLN